MFFCENHEICENFVFFIGFYEVHCFFSFISYFFQVFHDFYQNYALFDGFYGIFKFFCVFFFDFAHFLCFLQNSEKLEFSKIFYDSGRFAACSPSDCRVTAERLAE